MKKLLMVALLVTIASLTGCKSLHHHKHHTVKTNKHHHVHKNHGHHNNHHHKHNNHRHG